jgi:large subunit ribosomal protein L18
MSVKNRKDQRVRRHLRIRQRILGTAERPRMAVCVSNKHFYVQFVDDGAAHTLAAATSLKLDGEPRCNLAGAKRVGEEAARVAMEKGIRTVVVDRGGFRFHGRVKQIVEAAVAAGLSISNGAAGAAEEAK